MGLACKITGHKWNKLPDGSDGCICQRCGERRNEGHDYRITTEREEWVYPLPPKKIYGHFKVCSVCDHWESVPSEVEIRRNECRETGHDWNGCKCTRCGKIRDEGHDWQKAVANFGAKEHRRQCRICGRHETERHSFKHLPDCRRRCTVCGYTMTWHEFRRGECMTCGIDESDYYCKLILSGKAEYGAHEYSPVDGSSRRYGTHVESVPALRAIALADEMKGLYDSDRTNCVNKLAAIARKGGADAHEANLALRDIVLSDSLGWGTLTAFNGITDPEMASDPKVLAIAKRVQKASDEYDNAMIAIDSGIGRSG